MDITRYIFGMDPCYVSVRFDKNSKRITIDTKYLDEKHKKRADEYVMWCYGKTEISLSKSMFTMGNVITFQKFFIVMNRPNFTAAFDRFSKKYEYDIRSEI